MSREKTKQRFKLWLLALALSLALTWYIINLAPGSIHLHKTDGHTRDADRHRAQAQIGGRSRRFEVRPAILPVVAPVLPATDDDLTDWPEFIELER